jgi:DNA sulfur modification protein DndD
MIIKKIRFKNFLVFPGEQALSLPSEEDSSLVVILAPNNTGKTTIVRALKFLFYARYPDDCTRETAYKVINDKIRQLAANDEEIEGWIEATIERDGRTLELRRTIKAKKSNGNLWRTTDVCFEEVVRNGAKTDFRPDDDNVFQRTINTLVPEPLFDAFYFQGEPLKGQLLKGVFSIRENLAGFLHEHHWEEARAAAENARLFFFQELTKANKGHKDYVSKLEYSENIRANIVKEKDKLAKREEELEAAQEEFESVSADLAKLGDSTESEKWVSELRRSRADQEQAQKKHERADADLCRIVSSSRGCPFVLSSIPSVTALLKKLENENILPADVSEGFVERVLKQKTCICGRDHDKDSKAAWTLYKDKTLTEDANRGLTDLLNTVTEGNSQNILKKGMDIANTVGLHLKQRTEAIAQTNSLKGRIKDIEDRLEKSPVEQIGKLTQQLKKLFSKKEELGQEINRIKAQISSFTKHLESAKKELEKLKPVGAAAKKQKSLEKAQERASALRDLISQSLSILKHSFRKILQRSVTRDYDEVATDKSHAIIKPDLLPALEKYGQQVTSTGGGQSQLLAVSYIVALAKLRKELHQQLVSLGINLGKIGDQSFVLDSPFANTDNHYSKAIARFLICSARQVVVLMARQQWDLVRGELENNIAKIYSFTLHTPKEQLKADLKDFDFVVGKETVRLLDLLPSGELPYTEIRTLK